MCEWLRETHTAHASAPSQTASQGNDEFNQAPQRTSGAPQAAAATNFDDFEDDIPF